MADVTWQTLCPQVEEPGDGSMDLLYETMHRDYEKDFLEVVHLMAAWPEDLWRTYMRRARARWTFQAAYLLQHPSLIPNEVEHIHTIVRLQSGFIFPEALSARLRQVELPLPRLESWPTPNLLTMADVRALLAE